MTKKTKQNYYGCKNENLQFYNKIELKKEPKEGDNNAPNSFVTNRQQNHISLFYGMYVFHNLEKWEPNLKPVA